MDLNLQRGDVVICTLSGDYGKPRPAVVVQSDLFVPTHDSITICPITSYLVEAPLFRLAIQPASQSGLKQLSHIMVDKIMTLKREKIRQKIGILSSTQQRQLNQALKFWLGLE